MGALCQRATVAAATSATLALLPAHVNPRSPPNKKTHTPHTPEKPKQSACVLKSRAFVSAGLAPKVIHRNLSPAELYEMVSGGVSY